MGNMNIFEIIETVYLEDELKKREVLAFLYELLEEAQDNILEKGRNENPSVELLKSKFHLDLILKDYAKYKEVEKSEEYSTFIEEDEEELEEETEEEDITIKETTDIKKFKDYQELRVIEGDKWRGRRIRGFRLNRKYYEVSRFSTMLVQVITLLYEADKNIMLEDVVDVLTIKGSKGGVYISKSNKDMSSYEEIGEGVYVNKGLALGVMAKVIERVLETYGYFYWDFGIYVLKKDKDI